MTQPSPDTLINRELGILEFQRRVLAQADDPSMPLLERLKFLCIFSSNLDEFFEVRVAGLKEQIRANATQRSPDGMTPRQQYRAVSETAHALVARQYELFNQHIIPELAAHGIHFIRRTQWNEAQAAWIRDYFFRELMPVLTPVGLDPSHPFPRVLNKSLNFAVELSGRDAFGRALSRAGAPNLESVYSGSREIEQYVAGTLQVDFVYGVGAASERYFGVPPARLSRSQAALLAAVLPNPSRLRVAPAWVSRRRSSAIAINVIIVSKTGLRDVCQQNPGTTPPSGTRRPRRKHFRRPAPESWSSLTETAGGRGGCRAP